MGGVQHTTLLFADYLSFSGKYEIETLLPNSGPFSDLLKQNLISTSFYYPLSYWSTSISLFNDQLRIPNPMAWIWNIFAIIFNIFTVKRNIDPKTELVISKGLLNHFTSGIACKILKIPVICHLQDLISDRYFGFLKMIFNQFATHLPTFIVCDGRLIQTSLGKNNKLKSSVIINGINTENLKRDIESGLKIRQEFNIPQNAYIIGHVARMTPWKGQSQLLKSFIEYASENSNSYLMLIGKPIFDKDDYFISLKRMIKDMSLNHRIIMPGYRNDLQSLFSAMDLFLYPSLEKDTSPLALISAISSGLPVGMSTIDSLSEIAEKCHSIDLFNPFKIEEMISIMRKYESTNKREKTGIQNREFGKQNFDIMTHAKELEMIIEQVYKGN